MTLAQGVPNAPNTHYKLTSVMAANRSSSAAKAVREQRLSISKCGCFAGAGGPASDK